MHVELKADFEITIAEGTRADSKFWRNQKYRTSELFEKLSHVKRTGETSEQYFSWKNSKDSTLRDKAKKIKDVGGFLGGELDETGLRQLDHIRNRSILTWDIDSGIPLFWIGSGICQARFSTHSHTRQHPRFKIVAPLSRPVTGPEYETLSRILAAEQADVLGVDAGEIFTDDTTHSPEHFQFWPSAPKDAEVFFEYQDGAPLDVDRILDSEFEPYYPKKEKTIAESNDGKQLSEENREKVLSALKSINPDCNYEDWIRIGKACKNAGLTLADWDEWSKRGEKYSPDGDYSCSEKWKTFNLESDSWNAGTIFKYAKAAGWNESQKDVAPLRKTKIKRLADVREEEAKWLITGYLPAGEVAALCGDGGTGKTTLWAAIAATVTTGTYSMFDQALNIPEGFPAREPQTVLFFSCEDSVPKVLVKRLRRAGADFARIIFYDADNTDEQGIYFDSPELEDVVKENRPGLVVFDPIQSFIPPGVTMAARNEMRKCIGNLTRLGHKYGATFLIVVHTNKKVNVSGRSRISDSSDIWDISRSVLIVGNTQEEGTRYLSQEKNSYDKLAPTIIFTVSDEGLRFKEITTKRDRDFVMENSQPARGAFALAEAQDLILAALKNGETPTAELDKRLLDAGVSVSTIKRAKKALHDAGKIAYRAEGYGPEKRFYVRLIEQVS